MPTKNIFGDEVEDSEVNEFGDPIDSEKKPQSGFWGGVYDTTIGAVPALVGKAADIQKDVWDIPSKVRQGDLSGASKSLVKGAIGPIGTAAAEAHLGEFKKAKEYYDKGRKSEAFGHALAGAIPGVGPIVADITETAIGETEPDPAKRVGDLRDPNPANAAGKLIGTALTASLGTKAGRKAASDAVDTAAKPYRYVKQTVKESAEKVQPYQAMFQALRPRNVKVNFEDSLKRSMPEVKRASAKLGVKPQDIDSALEVTKEAKRDVWSQYSSAGEGAKAAGVVVDGNKVADSIIKSVPSRFKQENPAGYARLVEEADTYRKFYTLDEAESLLRQTNDALDSYYNKFPGDRTSSRSNPEVAKDLAASNSWRDEIYRLLDDASEGAAPKELKQRYGALMELEDALYRRKVTLERQAPKDLSQQLSRWSGTADKVKGGFNVARGMVTGDLGAAYEGLSELATGAAKGAAADYIKELNHSNSLIRRAFEQFNEPYQPVTITPRPGPIRTFDPNSGAAVTIPPVDPKAGFKQSPYRGVDEILGGPTYKPRNIDPNSGTAFDSPPFIETRGTRVPIEPNYGIPYTRPPIDPKAGYTPGGYRGIEEILGGPRNLPSEVGRPFHPITGEPYTPTPFVDPSRRGGVMGDEISGHLPVPKRSVDDILGTNKPSAPDMFYRVFPATKVKEFADQNGVSVVKARKMLRDEGWRVQ